MSLITSSAPPMSTQSPPSPSFRPTPDALVTAVRQHGALGARLIADYWRREGADPSAAAAAVHDAVPQLRTTTVRDVGLSHRAPAPFPADISGGPLDDLFTANLDRQQRAMQRAAHEARMFGQCLGAEVVTYGVKGVAAIDGAVTQFAARHVDELLRLGEPAGAAVADLGRILAGEPDTLAERQRQVILRLLKPREGERFYGMRADVRSALALAVLADDQMAADRSAGVAGAAIADLVNAAAPVASRIAGEPSAGVTAASSTADQDAHVESEGSAEADEGGHSL